MPAHLRRIDEPGHVHFWTISSYRRLGFFHHDGMKQVVVDALHRLQSKFHICLIGYVIMPEHVHVLLYPHERETDQLIPISTLLHDFKRHSGFHGKKFLRKSWRQSGELWSQPLNEWARGVCSSKPIWNTRGYDFSITHNDMLIEKLDYCHKNPVTRGLVASADQWTYSSYRFYELNDQSTLTMDWDKGWPIIW